MSGLNLYEGGVERSRVAAKIREGVASARAEIARLSAHADAGDALADDIESESPPPIEEVIARGQRLKLPLSRVREDGELPEPPRESGVSLSSRGVILAMRGGQLR